jgi:ABC-type polysaccharide/polyol phosphate transport system ATPase subunit
MQVSAPTPACDAVIRVRGVGKSYRLRGGSRTFKRLVLEALSRRQRAKPFWALQDVSFDVARGETLGLIGANGAGKSTLLGILAGTKVPTVGTVEVGGKVSAMLELGAGFHPDLTGRENIFLYGAVMGLSRRRMRDRVGAIVEFAGLQSFIDQPVKHYSSGMYVRLGFAVAVEVDPDILLIDEVLAVGDAGFQRKCLERIRAFRAAGKTLVIISHDLSTIRAISDRILLLDHGTVKGIGAPDSIVAAYQESSAQGRPAPSGREWGNLQARLLDVRLLDREGTPRASFAQDGMLRVEARYHAARRIENPVFGFAISDANGKVTSGSNTQIEGLPIPAIEGSGSVRLTIERLAVGAGDYTLSLSLHSADHLTHYHRIDNGWAFSVTSSFAGEGLALPCRWSIE